MKTLNKQEKIAVMKKKVGSIWVQHVTEGPRPHEMVADSTCIECEGYNSMLLAIEALQTK